jgi:3-hydroxyisobutyrate dehydrogenase-like beta-hydroxyacid dehydrogenase
MTQSIGLIGVGNLGYPIAENLLAAGYPLRIFNRTPAKAAPLVARGAVLVEKPTDVVEKGGVLLTVLSDDETVQAVADDAMIAAMGAGGIHVSLSTILPTTSDKLAAHHAERGVAYVGAPVFGRPEAAAARKLWVCTSGAAAAKERVKPILQAISQGIFDFGETPGAANVVKLMGNFIINSAIEAMAEASAVAEKHGIARADFLGMMTQTLFAAPVYQNYAKKLIAADFDKVGFTVQLALKDAKLMIETANDIGAKLPLGELVRDRLEATITKGRSQLDAAAFTLESAEGAGLEWFKG